MSLATTIILLIFGLFLVIKGADIFIEGSGCLAKKFKIPQIIIGLTVVAIGTSAPEAAVFSYYVSTDHKDKRQILFCKIIIT